MINSGLSIILYLQLVLGTPILQGLSGLWTCKKATWTCNPSHHHIHRCSHRIRRRNHSHLHSRRNHYSHCNRRRHHCRHTKILPMFSRDVAIRWFFWGFIKCQCQVFLNGKCGVPSLEFSTWDRYTTKRLIKVQSFTKLVILSVDSPTQLPILGERAGDLAYLA